MHVEDAVTASGTYSHSPLASFISLHSLQLTRSPFAGGKATRSMKLCTKCVCVTDSIW